MKLISKIYNGYYMDIDLVIAPRTRDDQESNKPLLTRYQSKIGNVSLIYDPSVYLVLKSGTGIRKESGETNSARIPYNLIYRFSAGLHNIYDQLGDSKLFHVDGSTLYIDHNRANEVGRRISIYNDVLVMMPAVIPGKENKCIKGITMFINDRLLGYLVHSDVLALIEMIDHFDMTTYTLLAALVDKIESMDSKIDHIDSQLNEINAKLNTLLDFQNVSRAVSTVPLGDRNPMNHTSITSGFNWESV